MFDAFAHSIDRGVRGLHLVGHHNAAPDLQPCGLGKRGLGTDAHRNHHQIGVKDRAVFQFDAGPGSLARGGNGRCR